MAAKTSEWRPGPTVCRCCLTEGCYKDISTEYFWMGKREVYAEMLAETFDLSIAYSQSGGPNSNSRLICEPCISRLREAADFKRQVAECEKTFLQHLDPSSSSVVFEVTPEEVTSDLDKDVKLEQIKIEKLASDDEFDAGPDFADIDDDDDLDDEPLTKLASRIPKTESMDATDLMDNATATLTLKRKSTKTKSPAKKIKKKEPKATASKVKPEKKKKDDKDDSVRKNAEMIIHYSTAYPFRMNEKSIRCVYCHEQFTDPEVFRMHMDDDHRKFSLRLAFHNIPKAEYIKADLSDLRCRLCDEKLNDLETTALHLNTSHGKEVDTSASIGVMPFKLERERHECAICQKTMPSLTVLIRHTITHFLSHTCSQCGSNYLTETAMIRHMRHKHQTYAVNCKICGQEFSTVEDKIRHQKVGSRCLPYPCSDCPERFMDWKTKMHHMSQVHGRGTKEFRCDDCSLIFAEEKEYYLHRRLEHSEMSVACNRCGLKFTSGYALKRHEAEKCD